MAKQKQVLSPEVAARLADLAREMRQIVYQGERGAENLVHRLQRDHHGRGIELGHAVDLLGRLGITTLGALAALPETDVVAAAAAHFDSGAFLADLARRVAYRTESQDPASAPALQAYLQG